MTTPPPGLARHLGLGGAVVVGLGSVVGAGVFGALAPAAAAAGAGLLVALGVAAAVAWCNATSSARLAAVHPESGGTYVYAGRRLGAFWGHQAGWAFVVGKTASCAAMALVFGSYVAPEHPRLAAAAAVVVLTGLNYRGVQRSVALARVLVTVTLAVLALVVLAALTGGTASPANLAPWPGSGPGGVLQAAGLLFFAFAGYARIATLGEEVRDPARTIPRAIPLALGIALVVYAAVAVAALLAVGPAGLAAAGAPLRRAVEVGSWSAWAPLVTVGAATACLGSLLALVLGVSRTAFAMARDHHLPSVLAAVHPHFRVPHRAELVVGAVVLVLVATADLTGAIGFSSFGVLVYYALANASALRMTRAERRPPRAVPVLGLVGCLVLALGLPPGAVASGSVVLALGAASYGVRALRGRTPRGRTAR